MSTFVLCVGCGEPLYGFSPCRWCTCERCGIDLLNGICPLCNSSNSCAYDHNQNSFNYPPDSYHPPHPTYETYSGDLAGNDSHFGYDCPPQFSLPYEPEPGYIQNYNSYPHNSLSFPQQYLCCDNCRGPHETSHCQPMNQNFYNSNSLGFDQSQPSQFPFLKRQRRIKKSSVENLVPIPSESEDECECDVPDCDDSQTINFSTFSNPLFDDFTSSDDESSHEEDIHEMSFKTYSNPLFDLYEETISSEFNPVHNEDLESTLKNYRFDTEPYLLESLPNRDTLMSSPLKIDSLLAEFAGALIFLKLILPGIDEADCDPEEDIHFIKRLLYNNLLPCPPEEIVSDNSNADIESFSPSPIPNKDSDSHMEEIDLPFTPDDPMPPGIEDDDYDSRRDISILEELLDSYSLSLPANESYHFDIPSPYRPPAKPPDGKTGTLNIKMLGDVSDQKVPIPNLMITCVLNQEKLPDLLSHQGLEAFQPSAECPMIINGKNISLLDVPLFHFYPP
nr:hypothetical protein [Tanacetum cinerariifolium]